MTGRDRTFRLRGPSPRPIVHIDDSLLEPGDPRPTAFLSSDRLLMPLFLLGVLALMTFLSADLGVTWDESVAYLETARSSGEAIRKVSSLLSRGHPVGAFRSFAHDPAWSDHPEVPFLSRLVQGGVHELTKGFLKEPVSFRAGSALLWVSMLGMLFLLAHEAYGRSAAWAAMGLALAVPRLFAHGLIAATESSLLFTWMAGTWVYLRCLQGRLPAWAFGLAMGAAFMAKFQSLGLLAALSLWGSFVDRPRASVLLGWGLLLGSAAAFIGQPVYWTHPSMIADNFQYYFRHFAIPCYFLGHVIRGHGPWYYSPLILAVTLPAPILALSLAGIFQAVAGPGSALARRLPLLFLWLAFFPLFLLMLPNAPAYDGERLFIQAYPAWVLLACGGLTLVWRWRAAWMKPAVALAFLLALFGIVRSHPYYLETYNALVGGPAGAEARGFETTYWSDAITRDVLDALNREVPPNGIVRYQGTIGKVFTYPQKYGKLRRDIGFIPEDGPGVTHRLLVNRQGMVGLRPYRRAVPIHEVRFQGASLVKLVKAGG